MPLTDVGLGLAQDRIFGLGGPPNRPEYVNVGTGVNPFSPADTQLQTEIGRKLFGSLSRVGDTVTMKAHFTASEGVGLIKELGANNAASVGTQLSRDTSTDGHFVELNKPANRELVVEISFREQRA